MYKLISSPTVCNYSIAIYLLSSSILFSTDSIDRCYQNKHNTPFVWGKEWQPSQDLIKKYENDDKKEKEVIVKLRVNRNLFSSEENYDKK